MPEFLHQSQNQATPFHSNGLHAFRCRKYFPFVRLTTILPERQDLFQEEGYHQGSWRWPEISYLQAQIVPSVRKRTKRAQLKETVDFSFFSDYVLTVLF